MIAVKVEQSAIKKLLTAIPTLNKVININILNYSIISMVLEIMIILITLLMVLLINEY